MTDYNQERIRFLKELAQDKPLEDPWIDPVSAFAGGLGGALPNALRSIGSEGLKALLKPLVSGAAGAIADYPIGAATEGIGEKYPSLALPFNVGAGMLSGKLPGAYQQGLPFRLQNQLGTIGELDPKDLVALFNKNQPGHSLKFDGIQEGFADIPNMYQFTPYSGPAKGATFLVNSLDEKAISKKLNDMIKIRQTTKQNLH